MCISKVNKCIQNTHCRAENSRPHLSLHETHNKHESRTLSDCAVQAHFVGDFASVMKRTGRNASAYENDVRSYPPIEDDLCRSRGRCTRDALLSCTSPALPPPSRIDRYYFRPVHDTR